MVQSFSYNDLIQYIRTSVTPRNQGRGIHADEKMYPDQGHFSCLLGQFFHLSLFPDFKLDYLSPSVKNVLGYEASELNQRQLYQLIHKEDRAVVYLATKKMIELMAAHLSEMTPLKTVFSLTFRMYRKDRSVVHLLNHDCVYKKSEDSTTWKGLSVCTDITNVNASNKVEMGVMNYGDSIDFQFPDEELKNLAHFFTPREQEILSLLVAGKSSAEIGELLCISRHTVDTHRRHMLAKSHLCNTAELVAFSLQNSLME